MNAINAKIGAMVAAAFILGCAVGGVFIQWRMNQRENRVGENVAVGEPMRPVASQSAPAGIEKPSNSARSVIINSQRLSDKEIENLERAYQVQIREGDYWYDRMNGSWGRRGGPTEGFIIAGLSIGGPLREDASNGDTGVFINGRHLHRVDVERLMQLGPVHQGRCWMDAQGYIGLEGQPAFGNIWVAARSLLGGSRKEGILSTYDKTGIAVFGY
jgi:hypothetical protein